MKVRMDIFTFILKEHIARMDKSTLSQEIKSYKPQEGGRLSEDLGKDGNVKSEQVIFADVIT